MIAYNQFELGNKFPKNNYYLLGFIHGFTFGFIPLSLYFILKSNKK